VTSRRGKGLIAAVITVVLAGSLTAVALNRDTLFARSPAAPVTEPRPVAVIATPLTALSTAAPIPTPEAFAAALAPTVTNPDLGLLTGQITDALTGQVLWEQGARAPQTPGSVTKVVTAAAVRLSVPLDQRLATTVVTGATPGQLVLVGGGDATLTAQPAGMPGYYRDAPRLDDLVDQIRASGTPVADVIVDTSLFPGPTMAVGWNPIDIEGGSIAPIESVMLDGGRRHPLLAYSPRTPTPALDTGRVLAQRLGLDPATVTIGSAPPDAHTVATVWSAPLGLRLHQMMVVSDDVTAETIGFELARARNEPATFDGSVAAATGALVGAGFDTSGLHLRDLSGLSVDDRIPAGLIDDVLTAATGSGEHAQALRPMLDDLAVGGGSGTLWDRFVAPSPGAGWVRAKTGTLDFVNALAGIVTDRDGRALTFTLMSTGTPSEVAKPALDAVAVALRACGCR
jgi:D-alanyl-D-alanine carboxypeptidase/D-alanyl-D-alanine-endopeptidase (penicillin-binding protein 4)